MVEPPVQHRPGIVDERKIQQPTRLLIHRPAQRHLDPVAVPVHARTLVPGRHIGQVVRRLEKKLFLQLDDHALTNSSTRTRGSMRLRGLRELCYTAA